MSIIWLPYKEIFDKELLWNKRERKRKKERERDKFCVINVKYKEISWRVRRGGGGKK